MRMKRNSKRIILLVAFLFIVVTWQYNMDAKEYVIKKEVAFSMWHYSGGYWDGNINKRLYDKDLKKNGGFSPEDLADGAGWIAELIVDLPKEFLENLPANWSIDNITFEMNTYKPLSISYTPPLEDLMYRNSNTNSRINYNNDNKLYTYNLSEDKKKIILKFAPKLNFKKSVKLKKLGAPSYIPEVRKQYGYNLGSMFKLTNGPSLGGARIYMAGDYPNDLSIDDIKPKTNGRLFATDKTVNVYKSWRPDQYSINDIKIGIDTFNSGGAMGIAFVYPLEFKFYYDPGFDADFAIKDANTNKDLTDKKLILPSGQATATLDIIPDYKATIGNLDDMELEWVKWYKGSDTSGELIREFTAPEISNPDASKITQPNLTFGTYKYTLQAKVRGIEEPKTITHSVEIINPVNDNRPLALVAIKQGTNFTTDDGANFFMKKDNKGNRTPNHITFKNLCEPKELQVDRYEWKLDDKPIRTSSADQGKGSLETYQVTTQGSHTLALTMYIGEQRFTDTITFSLTDTPLPASNTGVLRSDDRGNEEFDVTKGIPSSEELYANIIAKNYYIGDKSYYKAVTGTKEYTVTVKKTYDLSWEKSESYESTKTEYCKGVCKSKKATDKDTSCDGHTKSVTKYHDVTQYDSKTETKTYTVKRPFTYYILDKLHIYQLKEGNIQNAALPGGTVNIPVANYIPPTITYDTSNNEEDHLKLPYPEGQKLEIVLDSQHISTSSYSKPSIPNEDWSHKAENLVGKIKVANDQLEFNDIVLLDKHVWREETADAPLPIPEPVDISPEVLYKKDLQILPTKSNGLFKSQGNIIYTISEDIKSFKSNASLPSIKQELTDVNSVIVHTPVVAMPGKASVKKDIQFDQRYEVKSNDTPMILGRGTVVRFALEGEHRNIKGYGNRDYSDYTAVKQVKFPFDLYIGKSRNGEYVPRGTWYTLDKDKEYTDIFVPIWVDEGSYQVSFRVFAINADKDVINNAVVGNENAVADYYESYSQEHANTNNQEGQWKYIAYRNLEVEVVGRLFGFKITDIIDYPRWETVFRKEKDSYEATGMYYSVGTNNEDGKSVRDAMYTLPILYGSHPEQKNVGPIKTGYGFRFQIETIGDYDTTKEAIVIKPTFRYISKDGDMTKEVDLYYHQPIDGKKTYYIKVGDQLDQKQKQYLKLSNPYHNITDSTFETMSQVLETDINTLRSKEITTGNLTEVILSRWLRTYQGNKENVPNTAIGNEAVGAHQVWYGKYYLPNDLYVAPKDYDIVKYAYNNNGLDGNEDFWLKEGYIIVNFHIYTVKNGDKETPILTYKGSSNGGNMWQIEGYRTSKSDINNTVFNLKDGDILFYYTDKKATDDYRVGGSH